MSEREAIALRAIGPGGPVPSVVDLLEQALEKARTGEVIGVGIVLTCNGRSVTTSFDRGEGTISDLFLGVGYLQQRMRGLAFLALTLAAASGGLAAEPDLARPQPPTPRPPRREAPPHPRRALACPECGSEGHERYCRRFGHFKRRIWMTAGVAAQRAELRAAVADAAEEMRGLEDSVEEHRRAPWKAS